MVQKRKLLVAKLAVAAGAIPFLLWAYETGPDAGYTGVPKELGTCAGAAGCHVGTTNDPNNKGSVSVAFPDGMTYTPGVKQHLTVTISDPATTQRAWGFQVTARAASNTGSMAGSFNSTDGNTGLQCASATNLADELGSIILSTQNQTCPSTKPLAYIEHSLAGYTATKGQSGSGSYQFDWTPPGTNIGNITIYVAGNAANGDLSVNGDHVYARTYTLTPQASAGTAPAISQAGVISGASFAPGIVPDSWVAIQGTNLSSVTDTWDKAIVNGKLPTTLDNVSVSIGGKPAYIYYVSPTQINVVAPDVGTGSMQVTVTNGSSTSAAVTANSSTFGPAFFLWVSKYAVATRQDFSWAVANGTFAGTTTVPAKPGDVIILWGTGFGPTNPAAPVGQQVPVASFPAANPVSVTVGGINAQVFGTALAPGFAALYQVAIQIPASAPDGDLPVVASINGAQSPATTLITVKH
jgi:uncharacterized protein (TIGR03437 family)